MTKRIFFILSLMTGLCSCTNDDAHTQPRPETPQMRFSASTYRLETKAIQTEQIFAAGASIGIFGWGHKTGQEAPLSLRPDMNNNPYTTTNRTDFISPYPAHFPIAADTVINIYAYYPYTDQVAGTVASFLLKDQHDIMYATPVLDKAKDNVEKDENGNYTPIPLVFNHTLSAITIVIKKADEIAEKLTLEKIELLAYPARATLDIASGQLDPLPTAQNYLLPVDPQIITSQETVLFKDYLMWPGEAPTFRFTISDHVYDVKPKQHFIANRQQKYTFTIQAKDVCVSASISEWVEGPAGSGEIGM